MKCPSCGSQGRSVFKCSNCGEVRCQFGACVGSNGKKGLAQPNKTCIACKKGKYQKIS